MYDTLADIILRQDNEQQERENEFHY